MLNEQILKIEEFFGKVNAEDSEWRTFVGFMITTNHQEIKLAISDGQSCCENYGYFMSEDNVSDYIGAKLLGVELTDTCLNTSKLEDLGYEGDVMFVNLLTNKGTLQFVAYNFHNGYYGHAAVVKSQQLKYEVTL